ncbi:MAG: hypothetical protein CMQ17_11960 [Gammaproteobacteria bacterium]|jgi:hypothetical protein|nr:hypothetical protein [Gammaproteobacteria bacterium]MDP7455630.1 M28 family peptidase [Gammaproteobacteria bacterium]|tara:strand:- start:1789 stop:3417 length:1629 start_codon:yes stop_codon:yes gene_type:complete
MTFASDPLTGRTHRTLWFSVLALVLILFALASGQQALAQAGNDAWFGVPTPAQRQNIGSPPSQYVPVAAADLSLRTGGEELPAEMLGGNNIARYMQDIIAISQQSKAAGDALWGRIGGTEWELMTAQYMAEKFRLFGLADVRIDRMPRNPQWWPTAWEVTLLADESYGSGSRDIPLLTAFPGVPSPSTPESGIDAELIYVGAGTPADLLGRDVTGKIAVYHAIFESGAYSYTGRGLADQLIKAGALAAIAVHDIEANIQFFNRFVGSEAGPGFTISGDDGVFLEQIIVHTAETKPLRARIKLISGPRDGLITQNTYGMIPGQSDETVILTAHTDAYFDGAYDNASGLATLLALAKYYSRPGAPTPQRNLLFVGSGGHHAGRPGTPYTNTGLQSVGTAYMVENYPQLMDDTVLVLNVEHTALTAVVTGLGGIINTTTETARHLAVSNRSPFLLENFLAAIDRYGVIVPTMTNHFPGGDASNFLRAEIPVVNLISAGFWYHSSGDILENIPVQGLERTARMFAYFLDRVDSASRVEIGTGAPGN